MKKWGQVIDYGLKLNKEKKGNFPVWGTCLGFESLVYKFSNYKIPTTEVDTLNTNRKLNWKMKNYSHSLFRKELRKSVRKAMEGSNLYS